MNKLLILGLCFGLASCGIMDGDKILLGKSKGQSSSASDSVLKFDYEWLKTADCRDKKAINYKVDENSDYQHCVYVATEGEEANTLKSTFENKRKEDGKVQNSFFIKPDPNKDNITLKTSRWRPLTKKPSKNPPKTTPGHGGGFLSICDEDEEDCDEDPTQTINLNVSLDLSYWSLNEEELIAFRNQSHDDVADICQITNNRAVSYSLQELVNIINQYDTGSEDDIAATDQTQISIIEQNNSQVSIDNDTNNVIYEKPCVDSTLLITNDSFAVLVSHLQDGEGIIDVELQVSVNFSGPLFFLSAASMSYDDLTEQTHNINDHFVCNDERPFGLDKNGSTEELRCEVGQEDTYFNQSNHCFSNAMAGWGFSFTGQDSVDFSTDNRCLFTTRGYLDETEPDGGVSRTYVENHHVRLLKASVVNCTDLSPLQVNIDNSGEHKVLLPGSVDCGGNNVSLNMFSVELNEEKPEYIQTLKLINEGDDYLIHYKHDQDYAVYYESSPISFRLVGSDNNSTYIVNGELSVSGQWMITPEQTVAINFGSFLPSTSNISLVLRNDIVSKDKSSDFSCRENPDLVQENFSLESSGTSLKIDNKSEGQHQVGSVDNFYLECQDKQTRYGKIYRYYVRYNISTAQFMLNYTMIPHYEIQVQDLDDDQSEYHISVQEFLGDVFSALEQEFTSSDTTSVLPVAFTPEAGFLGVSSMTYVNDDVPLEELALDIQLNSQSLPVVGSDDINVTLSFRAGVTQYNYTRVIRFSGLPRIKEINQISVFGNVASNIFRGQEVSVVADLPIYSASNPATIYFYENNSSCTIDNAFVSKSLDDSGNQVTKTRTVDTSGDQVIFSAKVCYDNDVEQLYCSNCRSSQTFEVNDLGPVVITGPFNGADEEIDILITHERQANIVGYKGENCQGESLGIDASPTSPTTLTLVGNIYGTNNYSFKQQVAGADSPCQNYSYERSLAIPQPSLTLDNDGVNINYMEDLKFKVDFPTDFSFKDGWDVHIYTVADCNGEPEKVHRVEGNPDYVNVLLEDYVLTEVTYFSAKVKSHDPSAQSSCSSPLTINGTQVNILAPQLSLQSNQIPRSSQVQDINMTLTPLTAGLGGFYANGRDREMRIYVLTEQVSTQDDLLNQQVATTITITESNSEQVTYSHSIDSIPENVSNYYVYAIIADKTDSNNEKYSQMVSQIIQVINSNMATPFITDITPNTLLINQSVDNVTVNLEILSDLNSTVNSREIKLYQGASCTDDNDITSVSMSDCTQSIAQSGNFIYSCNINISNHSVQLSTPGQIKFTAMHFYDAAGSLQASNCSIPSTVEVIDVDKPTLSSHIPGGQSLLYQNPHGATIVLSGNPHNTSLQDNEGGSFSYLQVIPSSDSPQHCSDYEVVNTLSEGSPLSESSSFVIDAGTIEAWEIGDYYFIYKVTILGEDVCSSYIKKTISEQGPIPAADLSKAFDVNNPDESFTYHMNINFSNTGLDNNIVYELYHSTSGQSDACSGDPIASGVPSGVNNQTFSYTISGDDHSALLIPGEHRFAVKILDQSNPNRPANCSNSIIFTLFSYGPSADGTFTMIPAGNNFVTVSLSSEPDYPGQQRWIRWGHTNGPSTSLCYGLAHDGPFDTNVFNRTFSVTPGCKRFCAMLCNENNNDCTNWFHSEQYCHSFGFSNPEISLGAQGQHGPSVDVTNGAGLNCLYWFNAVGGVSLGLKQTTSESFNIATNSNWPGANNLESGRVYKLQVRMDCGDNEPYMSNQVDYTHP